MPSSSTIAGCVSFFIGNCFLVVGLFGSMMTWHYEITPSKDWFDGHPLESSFAMLIDYMPTKNMTMVPKIERSLLMHPGGVVWWLLDEGLLVAPMALVGFGVLIPTIKVFLVGLWVFEEKQKESKYLTIASRLSRWTATDAVATAVVVGIALRAGIHAEHCVGYACYVMYCMLSTWGLWAMEARKTAPEFASWNWWAKFMPRLEIDDVRFLPIISLMFFLAAFSIASSLFATARVSVVRGKVLEEYIHKMVHAELQTYEPFLPLIGLTAEQVVEGFAERTPLPSCEASLIGSVRTLMTSGHPYTVFGCAFLFICVFLVPVLQALMATGFAISRYDATAEGLSTMQLVSDFVMLDVLVFGLYIACLIVRSVHQLLQVELLQGFWVLAFVAISGHAHQLICKAVLRKRKTTTACV